MKAIAEPNQQSALQTPRAGGPQIGVALRQCAIPVASRETRFLAPTAADGAYAGRPIRRSSSSKRASPPRLLSSGAWQTKTRLLTRA